MPDFETLPLPALAASFIVAAAVVWLAGTRLAGYVEELAHRTGIGQAFAGALLLGGITSLPEAATTVTASAVGNAPLAVNNIFGGIALQLAVLALADWIARGRALSSRIGEDSVLLQAALLIGVLGVATAGVLLPDRLVFGVGAWAAAVCLAAILAFLLIHRHRDGSGWRPREQPRDVPDDRPEPDRADPGTPALALRLLVAAAAIVLGGYVVAVSGDAIAERTGLGAGFVGAVAVAFATSLPELSTTLGAVRLGAYAMAFANIFGANILDASIVLLADVVYPGPPVLTETDASSAIACVLGIVLTAVLMVGLLSRERRVVLGLGLDSAAVLLLYVGGIALIFRYAT